MIIAAAVIAPAQQIALLKYNGGGDWYANPTSLPNLIKFCNQSLGMTLDAKPATVEVGSADLYRYPFVHMTGHGNVAFTDAEAENLRNYLIAGGFLHADDNYGMSPYIRAQMKKVFPELELVELPYNHPIFHQKYNFPNGLPKIHEHDNKPPQAFALFWEGRMVFLFTCDGSLGSMPPPAVDNITMVYTPCSRPDSSANSHCRVATLRTADRFFPQERIIDAIDDGQFEIR